LDANGFEIDVIETWGKPRTTPGTPRIIELSTPLMLFAARTDRRAVTAVSFVVALHVALVALLLTRHDTAAPLALGSHTITAELLQREPIAVAPAIQSKPAPTPPNPAPRVTRDKPMVRPTPMAEPLPVAQSPSSHEIGAPAPAEPTPPTSAPETSAAPEAPAAAAASAQGKPTMELNAPKNVSHLDCRIDQPEYPTLSKRRGETGTVYVRFVVGLSGQIEDIQLKKTSGYGRLDDAALAAMHDSACKPYVENGTPVRAAYTQPFNFSLNN
jgi:periplasmic protein TonB